MRVKITQAILTNLDPLNKNSVVKPFGSIKFKVIILIKMKKPEKVKSSINCR